MEIINGVNHFDALRFYNSFHISKLKQIYKKKLVLFLLYQF